MANAASLTPLIERVTGDCPTCGFAALQHIRVYHLSPTGVTMIGERLNCGRCAAERKRA